MATEREAGHLNEKQNIRGLSARQWKESRTRYLRALFAADSAYRAWAAGPTQHSTTVLAKASGELLDILIADLVPEEA